MIGILLFATLQAVRRKDRSAPTIADERPSGGDAGEASSSSDAVAPVAVGAGSIETSPEAAQPDTYSLDETPDWEPHEAARLTEDDGLPSETPNDDGIGTRDEEPPADDVWADPTPTAMSDAASFDDAAPEVAEREEELFSTEAQEPAEADAFADVYGDGSIDAGTTSDAYTSEDDAERFEPLTVEEPATSPEDVSPTSVDATGLEEASAEVAEDSTIPEEEPFERAGRWWFKRGSELLVYNEQTGEWMPSPTPLPEVEQPAARFGPDSSATHTMTDLLGAEPEAESEPEPEQEAEPEEPEALQPTGQQGFWKCPACGAVNGSTATTCRMCFAARPAD